MVEMTKVVERPKILLDGVKPYELTNKHFFSFPHMTVSFDSRSGEYSDSVGHKYSFKHTGSLVDLVDSKTKQKIASAQFSVMESGKDRYIFDDKNLVGTQVHINIISKNPDNLTKPLSAPKAEFRGAWVLPAYISYLRSHGVDEVIVTPNTKLEKYYDFLGFRKEDKSDNLVLK